MFYNARAYEIQENRKAASQPVDALVYPRFSGMPTFMRLPHVPQAAELDLALIGIPFDGGTTYRPGARFGPRNIRVQSAMIRPWNPVLKLNPFEKWRIGDFGDLSINPLSIEDTYRRITEQLGDVLRAGARTGLRRRRSFHSAAHPARHSQALRSGGLHPARCPRRHMERILRQSAFARHAGEVCHRGRTDRERARAAGRTCAGRSIPKTILISPASTASGL